MSKPEVDEVLFAYIAVAHHAVSLMHGTRKLPHYFQSYTIVVLTQLPFIFLLQSSDYIGRISKWGTILGAFDIKYMPHTFVKGQVLIDLVVEFAETPLKERMEKQNMDEKSVGAISLQEPLSWKVYVDGAVNHRGSGHKQSRNP